MTFIPQQEERNCFVACDEDKVKSGLCHCINRMKPTKIDLDDPKVKEIIDNTQKAIAKTIEQSKKNLRFPYV